MKKSVQVRLTSENEDVACCLLGLYPGKLLLVERQTVATG